MSIDVVQQIKEYNRGREKGPLKIKYKAMAESPFRFLRGSCSLFYEELVQQDPFATSPAVWACGDLHIENFGSYKGNNRLVYFDLNDFDEALLAPVLWEMSRLMVSVQIGATGFSKKEKTILLNTVLANYRNTLKNGKSIVIEKETARGLIKKLVNRVAGRKEMELVRKRTGSANADRLLVSSLLLALPKQEKKALINAFNDWLIGHSHKKFHAIDAGFRIAGTGSIGVKRYLVLLAYNNNPQKKLLLDIKQAIPSAVSAYIKIPQPAWDNEAARVIAVQEMMQHVSSALLSAFPYQDNWFVVKELQPMADKINLDQTIKQPGNVENYLADLGILAASAQLRSSGRKGSVTADELSDFANDQSWEKPLKEWTLSYAAQVNKDYAAYRKAWRAGFFASNE